MTKDLEARAQRFREHGRMAETWAHLGRVRLRLQLGVTPAVPKQ